MDSALPAKEKGKVAIEIGLEVLGENSSPRRMHRPRSRREPRPQLLEVELDEPERARMIEHGYEHQRPPRTLDRGQKELAASTRLMQRAERMALQ